MQLEKFAADSTMFDFDCTNLLGTGETITGAVTMAALPVFSPPESLDNLVFGGAVVNIGPITYPDPTTPSGTRTMDTGKGFQLRISAGTPSSPTQSRVYAVTGTFGTSANNTLTTKAKLVVLPPAFPAP